MGTYLPHIFHLRSILVRILFGILLFFPLSLPSFTVPVVDPSILQRCTTVRQLKHVFRRTALEYHPDVFAARLNEEYKDKVSEVYTTMENKIIENFFILRQVYEKRLHELEHPEQYVDKGSNTHPSADGTDSTDPLSTVLDPRQSWEEWFYHVCPLTFNSYEYYSTSVTSFSGITWSMNRNYEYRSMPREVLKNIKISLTDSLKGTSIPYEVHDYLPCTHCHQRGYVFQSKEDSNTTTPYLSDSASCTVCNGSGILRTIWNNGKIYRSIVSGINTDHHHHHHQSEDNENDMDGNHPLHHRHGAEFTSRTCIHCCGTGRGPTVLCPVCLGQGNIPRSIPGTLSIPPGIQSNDRLAIQQFFIPHTIDPIPTRMYPFELNVTIDPETIAPWVILNPHIQRFRSISLLQFCTLNHTDITLPTSEKINVKIENKHCCSNGGTHNIFVPGYGLSLYNGRTNANPMGGSLINNRGHVILTLRIRYPLRISEEDAERFRQCFDRSALDLLYSISDVLMEVHANGIVDEVTDSKYVMYACDASNPQRTLVYHTLPEFLE